MNSKLHIRTLKRIFNAYNPQADEQEIDFENVLGPKCNLEENIGNFQEEYPRFNWSKEDVREKKFGDTMSLHSKGREAKKAVEESRETISKMINSETHEIIFTSSATESANMIIKGVAFSNKKKENT